MCIKWVASGKLLQSTGSLAWCAVTTWRSGMGDGREAQEGWNICILLADSLCCTAETTQHSKATIFQLKKKKKKPEWVFQNRSQFLSILC